jgi:signal transduction histidine kinase
MPDVASYRPRSWTILAEIALAAATIAIILQTSAWRTTYAGVSVAAAVADLSAGIGLMAAGTALVLTRLRPAVGVVASLAGIAWLAADWAGWQGGPALARTVAMGIALCFLVLIIHLLALQQRDPARLLRPLVLPAYLLASGLALALLLFRDPRLDLHCWSNCTDDVLLIANQPVIAGIVGVAIPTFELAAGGVIALLGIGWLLSCPPEQRRAVAVIAVPAVLVGVGGASHGLALLADPHEGPRFALHLALFQARAWAAALLAVGLGWTVIRTVRRRSAVLRLAAELADAPAPGSVAPALASATGDLSLEVLYWVPHLDGYVDGTGRSRDLPVPGPDRAVTRVSNAGRHVGVVAHDPSVVGRTDLDRILGPAATLALDNERLRAEIVAKLGDVRASRVRIVAAEDAARARLERDLHDGAQQGLLAVAYELRQAAAAVPTGGSGGPGVHGAIGAAVREAEAMLSELREIAHGIHPVILEHGGLVPALRSLADRAPIPVDVRGVRVDRLPDPVERAAYAVVAVAIDGAARAGSPEVVVEAARSGDALMVEVEGFDLDTLQEMSDRVAAADGRMEREGRRLRVSIPCA